MAENDLPPLGETDQARLSFWLDFLDGQLLTLAQEFGLDPASPDRLQEVLQGSLLFIQLRESPERHLTADAAVSILHSRVKWLYATVPDDRVRARMYRLGMTLSSSRTVEARRDEFVAILMRMAAWDAWSWAATRFMVHPKWESYQYIQMR